MQHGARLKIRQNTHILITGEGKIDHQSFMGKVLDGMTDDEQQRYIRDNVYPVKRTYRVFNGSIIDGLPEKETLKINPEDRVKRADKFLKDWSENEARIIYGGNNAYYSTKNDEIHIKNKKSDNSSFLYTKDMIEVTELGSEGLITTILSFAPSKFKMPYTTKRGEL